MKKFFNKFPEISRKMEINFRNNFRKFIPIWKFPNSQPYFSPWTIFSRTVEC